eukprot:m.341479 g.341479  ORF g.341479 m.341479 type:complete len:363 (+) comp20143_c0_seq1:310-1398(+)
MAAKDFPALKNDLLLRAARGEPTERTPVWVMRQAGRYLPEFREERKHADFFTMCQTPELACKVTLQPLERFELDGAIIFSDILVIPQALGMTVNMVPGVGPQFPNPLVTPEDMKGLKRDVDVDKELGYVFAALTLTRHRLEGKVPLFGFCGAPWTLMAYMIEGGGSKNFSKAKSWLFNHAEASHELLDLITDVNIEYLVKQVEAGAQILQVFDTWAGELSHAQFSEFLLPRLTRIASSVKSKLKEKNLETVPMVIFAKGAHYALAELGQTEYDVIQLDWTMDPVEARKIVGPNKTLQGNMDPCTLYGDEDVITKSVEKMISDFGTHRHIANLGHGMHPTHNPERLGHFVDQVHKISEAKRKT